MNRSVRNLLVVLSLFLCAYTSSAQSSISIVPQPTSLELHSGSYTLGQSPSISIKNIQRNAGVVKVLSDWLVSIGSNPVIKRGGILGADISLVVDESLVFESKETYALKVEKKGISIKANTEVGLFYGVQTLMQLMPSEVFAFEQLSFPIEIPGVTIEDFPRFEWRGLMVDLSRHFFSKQVLMKMIDRMAMHKLNRLHLHLTDDPGWRIEIEKYPKLTEVGAIGTRSDPDAPPQYLTKHDIKELIDYAKDRYIMIVPEIDMPGHAGAAARAYPEYFDGNITFNIGKDETYEFVKDILDEVVALFPSPYIHFGGDELRNHHLESLPEVKEKMQEMGMRSIQELEGYFDRYVAEYIARSGRTPMGWDEVAHYDIGQNAIVQWWRGRNPEARDYAVNKGYRVVVSPANYAYLDYPQAVGEPGAPWEGNDNGPNSVELIYHWQMVPKSYSDEQAKQIIGIEAAVWTEFIRTERYMEFMMYPRLAAIAEIAWVPESERDYSAFKQRLEAMYRRYEAMGINYRVPVPGDPLAENAIEYLVN